MPVKKLEHANKYFTFDRKQKRIWKHTPSLYIHLVIKSLQFEDFCK